MGTWSHWVIFDLAPETSALPQGIPAEERVAIHTSVDSGSAGKEPAQARQGKNDFGNIGYGGPCPPGGTHRYFFRLYALDRALGLAPGATRSTVFNALKGHIVAEGQLMGRYSRTR
jgi:Raf kinase inhibitor-like YbhB/YbcL family protein